MHMMPLGQFRQPLNLPIPSSKMAPSGLNKVNWTLLASSFPSVFGVHICRRNLMQNKAWGAKIPVLKNLGLSLWRLLVFSIDALNLPTSSSKMKLSALYKVNWTLLRPHLSQNYKEGKAWRMVKVNMCNFYCYCCYYYYYYYYYYYCCLT